MSNSGTRTLFDWESVVFVFHSCNIRIVCGLWSQSNFHDMISISFGFIGLSTVLLSCTRMHSPTAKLSLIERFLFDPNPYIELLYPRPTKLEGGYTGFTLSVCPSVRPSVCRRHGFRSISQVCFGISISNFICMLMVAIGRSLLIFSDVTFKMATWRPYWIFWFPDSNFTLAFNFNFKLQRHNTYVYG